SDFARMASTKASMANDPSRQRSSFLLHVSANERELDKVMLDHSYSKLWSSHPGASHAQPAKMLFVPKSLRVSKPEKLYQAASQEINVTLEEESKSVTVPYDIARARLVMNECERHVGFARANPSDERTDEDWEEKLNRTGWTQSQTKLFSRIIKHLQADRLSKLACEGTSNEPVMRRIYVDKCAKMVRRTLAAVGWDQKLTHWLHKTLVQNLSNSLLGSYLNVLQTLRPKIPSLIDKMTGLKSSSSGRSSSTSNEALSLLLKRPWDPAVGLLSQHKPGKLPGSPILLMAPNGPLLPTSSQSRRMRFWNSQLSGMGKAIPVSLHTPAGSNLTVATCLENMVTAVKGKVVELKAQYSNRPIILVGWSVGALVATQISLQESVNGVVCLGFPSKGLNGYRGDIDEPLFACKTPCLFVVGQESSVCNQDDIENLREKMKAITGLVIVGGADERLRMSKNKKKLEGVTQSMVDRCIIDEIGEFLHKILTSDTSGDHGKASSEAATKKRERDKEKKEKKRKVQRDLYSELKGRQTPPSAAGLKRRGTLMVEKGVHTEHIETPSAQSDADLIARHQTPAVVPSAPRPAAIIPPPIPQKIPTNLVPTTTRIPSASLVPSTPTRVPSSTNLVPSTNLVATVRAPKPSLSLPGPSTPKEKDTSFSSQYAHFLAQLTERDGGKSSAATIASTSSSSTGITKPMPELEAISGDDGSKATMKRLTTSPTTVKGKRMRLVSLPIITTSSSTQPAALGTSPPGPVKPDRAGQASAMAKRVSLLAGKGAINFEKLKVAMNQGKSKDVKGNVGGVLESILGKGAGSKSNSQHAFIQALNSTKTQPLKQPRKLSGSKSPVYSKKPETKSSISTIQLISTTQLKGQTLANPAKMVKTSPALSQPTTTTTTISTLPAKNPLIPSEGSVQTIQKLQPTEVSVQTIQKLQFHDFPLTTVSLKTSRGVSTYTQAKILTDLQHGSGLTLNLLEDGKVKKVGAAAQPTLRANTTLHTVPMPRSSVSPPAPGSNVLTSPKADVSVGSVTVVSKGPISTPDHNYLSPDSEYKGADVDQCRNNTCQRGKACRSKTGGRNTETGANRC
ncbi:putative KAT8 regulatory NSL complex subunit 3, partial [Apostichopus japonicus]